MGLYCKRSPEMDKAKLSMLLANSITLPAEQNALFVLSLKTVAGQPCTDPLDSHVFGYVMKYAFCARPISASSY